MQDLRNSIKKVETVLDLSRSEKMKKRFEEVLGKRAPQFLASVVGAVNVNPALQKCDPTSVMASAMVSATLDLEVVPSFGFAALVPYGNKAQFQIMTKGMVQLALRSGQFKALNVGRLYKDEIQGYDPIKGTFDIAKNSEMRKTGEMKDVAGFFCYFSLINGFEKTEFWTIEEIVNHGRRYSKNFNNPTSTWQTNFEAMAEKTVLKNTLSKYAPLSTQMRTAFVADQAVFNNMESAQNLEAEYIDSPLNSPEQEEQETEATKQPTQAVEPKVEVVVEPKKTKKGGLVAQVKVTEVKPVKDDEQATQEEPATNEWSDDEVFG